MREVLHLSRDQLDFLKKAQKDNDLLSHENFDALAVEGDEYLFEVSEHLSTELKKTISLFSDANLQAEIAVNKSAQELMETLFNSTISNISKKFTAIVESELSKVLITANFSEYDGYSAIDISFEHPFLSKQADFSPDAFYYQTTDDFSDACESWDWASLLLDEHSPFYDKDSFTEIYQTNQSLMAMDQFIACHSESDIKTQMKLKTKEIAVELEDAIADEYDAQDSRENESRV